MITLDLSEIPNKLTELIQLIKDGNSLILTQADQPIAEIKPINKQKNVVPLAYVKENLLFLIIKIIGSSSSDQSLFL